MRTPPLGHLNHSLLSSSLLGLSLLTMAVLAAAPLQAQPPPVTRESEEPETPPTESPIISGMRTMIGAKAEDVDRK